MRKILAAAAVAGLLLTACAEEEPTVGETGVTGATGQTATTGATGATGPTAAATAADCAAGVTSFVSSGTLTIGTDNPAYPPYFQGGTGKDSEWKINDPNTGQGFESAVAYEIASRMGFSADQVTWVVVPFKQAYAPGAKAFDLDLNQVSYSAKRAEAVDFSESYYDVNQALVIVKGTPIADATSIQDLQGFTLAAPLGTTSYTLITDYIQVPEGQAAVYQTLSDSVAALNAGQVDGIVVDFPTALYIADPYVQEVKDSTVLAQFPNDAVEGGEYFGAVLGKDSPLTGCVNLALQEMKADGTLEAITTEWLSEKTNVGEVPVFSS
jgi:polar amino acid transport system substrate-binding protein